MKIRYFGLVVAIFAFGCEQSPDSYEDCVLQKIENVEPEAMGLLRNTCRKKFPESVTLKPIEGDPFEGPEDDSANTGQRMTVEEAFNLPPKDSQQ